LSEDYCPECGHLLPGDRLCSFCNFSQSDEQMNNRLFEMFDWVKEDYYRPILSDDSELFGKIKL